MVVLSWGCRHASVQSVMIAVQTYKLPHSTAQHPPTTRIVNVLSSLAAGAAAGVECYVIALDQIHHTMHAQHTGLGALSCTSHPP